MDLTIVTPDWAEPLLPYARYKGLYGGRGSGKSHERAEALIEAHILDPKLASVCLREFQSSIRMSVKRLLEQKIQKFNVGHLFSVYDACIKRRGADGLIIFQGMQTHNAASIKSLEAFEIGWFEEADSASARSLELLRPTFRREGSELWFTWNPRFPTDPVDLLFRGESVPPDAVSVCVNYFQNPWATKELYAEAEFDRQRDFERYRHIWLGEYESSSERAIFRNWRIEEFEAPPDASLLFGADWGFATDPTTLVRCYIIGRRLYVDYEAYKVGCEIADTPDLFLTVPESEKWPIRADSARPETISHMRKHGFDKMVPATKGPNSIKEGVEFLKSYDIIVHPRCINLIAELTKYSYKVDPHTGQVLPVIEDKNNNMIDALRYACEAHRRLVYNKPVMAQPIPMQNRW